MQNREGHESPVELMAYAFCHGDEKLLAAMTARGGGKSLRAAAEEHGVKKDRLQRAMASFREVVSGYGRKAGLSPSELMRGWIRPPPPHPRVAEREGKPRTKGSGPPTWLGSSGMTRAGMVRAKAGGMG